MSIDRAGHSAGANAARVPRAWDIFCRVVDNFGDIGFCWRLAKCLEREHGFSIRLWIDDLERFARFEPGIDPLRPVQSVAGIEIRRLVDVQADATADREFDPIGDVVVQGFGSPLPAWVLAAMAARPAAPAWVDLEYLSAESWVDEFHGRPSPQSHPGLLKHFFFPGFSPASGGVLREQGLEERRRAFCAEPQKQNAWWAQLGLGPQRPHEHRVSLFCYPNPGALALLRVWAGDPASRWTVLVPDGTLEEEMREFLGGDPPGVGKTRIVGQLALRGIPFLSQDDYDHLLWSCDVNFVRGEDSFVRAQWARRPFIWHIYPQEGATHLTKLDAFLDLYTRGWPSEAGSSLRAFSRGWNTGAPGLAAHWQAWWEKRAIWESHLGQWPAALGQQSDLACRLAQFAAHLLK